MMALSGLDSTPRAGKSLKGASWSAFSILVTQGHVGWRVGAVRGQVICHEGQWETWGCGGVRKSHCGEPGEQVAWSSSFWAKDEYLKSASWDIMEGHAPRDVVKPCTGMVVVQYVPCLNWTRLNWVALIELKMPVKVENKSCQNKLCGWSFVLITVKSQQLPCWFHVFAIYSLKSKAWKRS